MAHGEFKNRVIRRHTDLIQEHCFGRCALSQETKHPASHTDGQAHAPDCRARIFHSKSPAEVWKVFQEYRAASTPRVGQVPAAVRRPDAPS